MTNVLWTPAYVALGSNLRQPMRQVQRALTELAALDATRLITQSSLYQSAPMGPQDQPAFVNSVVGLLTQLCAVELLAQLQTIERRMGRQTPVQRWGPRIIDLDILIHGDTRSDTLELKLPHPGLMLRNFVLVPLAEIAPQLVLPAGITATAAARRMGDNDLRLALDEPSGAIA
jgi:2-amino-4-hydroxy-6-hydroxymethyldihydropteridine diphosphokinase